MHFICAHFFDLIGKGLFRYKAVKQLVARLGDRYSSFLTPEEYRFALRRPIQSELKYLVYQYTGVGMEVLHGLIVLFLYLNIFLIMPI
mgnify:FL=1